MMRMWTALCVLLLLLAACGPDDVEEVVAPDDTPVDDGEPIRIGIVTSQAGPYAGIGQESINAGEFAAEYHNAQGGVAGREVEVVVVDDQGTPEGAVEAMERAILQENAPFITGTVASSQGLAMAAQIEALDGIYIASINKTDALTGESCNPRVFRSSSKDSMDLNTVRPWLEDRPEQTWTAVGADYEWGHDSVEQFSEHAEELGREVVGTHFPALGETDYGSYISQIQGEGAEGLWVSIAGGDANTFVQQAEPFGVIDEKSVTIGNNFMNDQSIATLEGLAEGIWGTVNYHHSIDTPANVEYVDAWNERFDRNPHNFEGETYIAIQMFFAAVEAAGSVEPQAVADALNDLDVDTILGTMTVRGADGDLLTPNFLGEVVETQDGYDWDIQFEATPEETSPEPSPDCTNR